ncbi:MAG: polyamine ABC transporter substrate-binding protein [Mycobacterium sp.]
MPSPDSPLIRSRPNRRQFLQHAALLAAGAPALAALLDACSEAEQPDWPANLKIAAPNAPVTWDIAPDNRPTPDGLGPEKNATLNVYTYADYISPEAIKSFEDRYRTRVEITTFNNTDEALTKIRDGAVDFDVYTPGYDQIGRLVTGGLLRPLNHSYVPNITNVWPVFSNPWYDGQWRYSVPYTVYTTGIGWRTDQVPAEIGALVNPYDVLWDPAYRNQTAVVDDGHTVMAMVLLKLGITDVNTSSTDDLQKVGEALSEMKKNTAPKITMNMNTELPAGLISVSQMWSGDIIAAKDALPEGVSADVLRYWFPSDGKGLVDNDLMVVPRRGKNPVAAQLFLNHMLDPQVAKGNFAAVGSQPPQVSINPDSLVQSGLIPANLKTAIVRPEYFDVGYRILELDPANDEAWQRIWRNFKFGRP